MQVHENEDVIQWHYSTIQHIQSHLYEYFVDWILLLLHMMGGITAIAWEKEYQIFRFHWNQCQKVIATIKVTTFSFFFLFSDAWSFIFTSVWVDRPVKQLLFRLNFALCRFEYDFCYYHRLMNKTAVTILHDQRRRQRQRPKCLHTYHSTFA